ncbi:MAG: hypothetical protein KF857_12290 [Fimbriimonadaceae bacterium]|nr:hypothetical protein [Fimbriimonadaceae bacterium]
MSTPVLVLLAAAALAAWAWEYARTPKPARPDVTASLLVGLAGLASALGLFKLTGSVPVALTPVVAAAASVLSATTTGCPAKTRPSLVALGAFPAVLAMAADIPTADWLWIGAALAGVTAFGFWANWTKSHRPDSALLPLATVASALLLLFLKIQAADFGLQVTGALALVATVGLALADQLGDRSPWAGPALGAVVTGACVAVFQFGFHKPELALVVGTAGATALVIGWLWGDGAPTPTAGALGALAWTGVATVGFSQAQTPGIAAAALVGLAVTGVVGRPSAAAALSPILALAAYRLLRNLAPDTLDSFDIGQHYVTVGLLVGAATVVALNEFVGAVREQAGTKGTAALVAAWVAAGGLAAFAAVFLGDRGTVGVVLGLALGGALSCLSGRDALPGAVFGGGLAWLVAAVAPVLTEAVDIKKDNKMAVFAVAVLVVAALAATAGLLTRPNSEESSAEA